MAPQTASSSCWVLGWEVLWMLLLAQNLSRERMLNPLTPGYSSRRRRDSWECVMPSFLIFSLTESSRPSRAAIFYVCEEATGVSQLRWYVGTCEQAFQTSTFPNVNSLFRKYGNVTKIQNSKLWRLDWNFENWRPFAEIQNSLRIGFWFGGNIGRQPAELQLQ